MAIDRVSIGDTQEYFQREITIENYMNGDRCSNCGACCTNYLQMTHEEALRIRKYVRKNRIQPRHSDAAQVDMTCPFRDHENFRCDIYEVRPEICRLYECRHAQGDGVDYESMGAENTARCVALLANPTTQIRSMRAMFGGWKSEEEQGAANILELKNQLQDYKRRDHEPYLRLLKKSMIEW